MGIDTHGKIRGFVRHEEILNYIKQRYDKKATADVTKQVLGPLKNLNFPFELNKHSTDNNVWYMYSGFICFNCYGESRQLFYDYNNINTFENLDYYRQCNLESMVKAETTFISLGCYGKSIPIITDLVAHFGGGWVDENDCDDKPYYPIKRSPKDGSIMPVKYVTWEDIYKKFGCVVVVKDNKG